MDVLANEELGPFLTNQAGEHYLHPINRNTFATLNSTEAYLDYFGPDYFKESTFYIIAGTDSGLLVNHLNKIGLPKGARVLFVELPEVLERLPEVIDYSQLDPAIAISPFSLLVQQAHEFNVKEYFYSNDILLVKSLCSADSFYPAYHQLYDAIKEQMQALRWKINLGMAGAPFIIRQLQNLAENRIPAECLKNSFCGKTAVVLGGGPSLDEILPWLLLHRDQVVILAASRVSKRLIEVGLEPHMIISIDPHPASFDVSREMLHFSDKVVFVHNYHVSPLLLGQWTGRSAFLGGRFPWSSELNPVPMNTSGPTVTHVATGLAIEMGFSQIILGGVDMCFSREGYTHSKGTIERESGPNLAEVSVWVETNSGEKAASIHPFAYGIEVMGQAAAFAQTKDCRVVNPAAGAAKIPFVEHLALEEIRLPAGEIIADEMFEGLLPKESSVDRISHVQRMLEELERGKNEFLHIRKLADEGLKANAGLFGHNGKEGNFKFKKKMDRIQKKIDKVEGSFTKLTKVYGIRGFLKIVKPDRQEWSDEDVEMVGALYYRAYRISSNSLVRLLEGIEQRLHSRLDEESDSPDFKALAQQWRGDQQLGRAKVWRVRNPERFAQLKPEQKELLQSLEEEFSQMLASGEDVCPAYDRRSVDYKGARAKAKLFFGRKEKQKLGSLLEGISQHKTAEAVPVLQLARGFMAELDGNFEQALGEYEALLGGEMHPGIEDALLRVTAISADHGDFNQALSAFQCLTELSPIYAPKYAKLLRLVGRNDDALDVYAGYLEQVPDDISTCLVLGKFY